jgi:hypothetical protein
MRSALLTLLVSVVACGSSGGGNNPDSNNQVDAKVFHDAPPNVPAMITISGTAAEPSTTGGADTPLAGVVVEAHKASDDSLVTMATTDAQGKYSLTITTNGVPVDGYLKATLAQYGDTYLFPPAPLIADFTMGSVNMLKPGTVGLLYTVAGVGQMSGKGTVALEVLDATGTPVDGATITTNPAGTYRYGNPPLQQNTATVNGNGIAADLNAAPGSIDVSATKAGTTFHTHTVKVFANSFTTTIVQP